MNDLHEIEAKIAALPPDKRAALRAWFAEFDADAWDRQFAADVSAGRLDEETQRKMKRLRGALESLELLDDPEAFSTFMRSIDDIRHGRLVSQEDLEKEFL